ncbi:hypothetical protein L873DRAFT_1670665 [Choiromyces venosus 120613-1]|uniref:Uncharacterized protein n=1 Tax=Choiromyces venosus 120613-1 TaxID=1336337 RepID=A0A3N4KBG3_9PEZI|nr:hypothetical protein L873DRAFT_1670665 [Choiromyces venosus 120613-1]
MFLSSLHKPRISQFLRGRVCKAPVSGGLLVPLRVQLRRRQGGLGGGERGIATTPRWGLAHARSPRTYPGDGGNVRRGGSLREEYDGAQSIEGGNNGGGRGGGGRSEAETEAEYENPDPNEPEPGRPVVWLFLCLTLPVFILSNINLLAPFLISARDLESGSLPTTTTTTTPTSTTTTASLTKEQLNAYIKTHRPDLLRLQYISQTTWANTTLTPIRFFPQCADPAPWHTMITYAFNHGGIMHYFFCYMGIKAFVPSLSFAYGDRRAAATFLLGSAMAGAGITAYERWLNPWASVSGQELNAALRHHRFPAAAALLDEDGRRRLEKRLKDAVSANLGSSGGIIALGTVAAIVCPGMELNLMFIPYGFKIRTLMAALAAFDFGGAFLWDYGLGIGHTGHLAGYVSGILLYTLWLRRVPFAFQSRAEEMLRKAAMQQRSPPLPPPPPPPFR